MRLGLDTSVVLRLLVGEPELQAAAAGELLEEHGSTPGQAVLVSDLVVGESYFALRHHYDVPHGRATAALSALLADRRITATGVAREVLAAAGASGGPGVMDRLIHGDYREAGASLVTFDRTAARLEGSVLIEP